MSILNNFVNPWESGGALGSQALGTEVLEGNVLAENTITTNNTTSYGNVYYTNSGSISIDILKKAVNYSKKLFEMNGIRWINFTFIKYEEWVSLNKLPSIYDASVAFVPSHISGSHTYNSFNSYIVYLNKDKYKSYHQIGWELTHELTHQFVMRLGWLLWGFQDYLQPHGMNNGNDYDRSHFNYKSDGSLYPNLLMSGHGHTEISGGSSNPAVQKMIPCHRFLIGNFYSMMNLDNSIIAEMYKDNFYWEVVQIVTANPLPVSYISLYLKRKELLINQNYSKMKENNLSAFNINSKFNKTITPFNPNSERQKIYLKEYSW